MGLFDLFKKKRPDSLSQNAPSAKNEAPAHGWDAITEAFEALYPGQTNPVHRAPLVYRMNDISDNAAAFDGISTYDAGDYWHFVTYGLTELYSKRNNDSEYSGFGYELTFKLEKNAGAPPEWPFLMLESIGKAVWNGEDLAPGHTIRTGPVDGNANTRQNALLALADPQLPRVVETPNGKVHFLLLFAVPNEIREKLLAEYDAEDTGEQTQPGIIDTLRLRNPHFVTRISTTAGDTSF